MFSLTLFYLVGPALLSSISAAPSTRLTLCPRPPPLHFALGSVSPKEIPSLVGHPQRPGAPANQLPPGNSAQPHSHKRRDQAYSQLSQRPPIPRLCHKQSWANPRNQPYWASALAHQCVCSSRDSALKERCTRPRLGDSSVWGVQGKGEDIWDLSPGNTLSICKPGTLFSRALAARRTGVGHGEVLLPCGHFLY